MPWLPAASAQPQHQNEPIKFRGRRFHERVQMRNRQPVKDFRSAPEKYARQNAKIPERQTPLFAQIQSATD